MLLFVLILSGLPSHADGYSGFDALSPKETITAKTLNHAGFTRVTDILRLADGLHVNSTDGYTWRVSMNGLSTFQNQHWTVMLDGQRVELRAFDLVHLNMLPVSFGQIKSVEVVTTPSLHEGIFTDAGLIHIHTHTPRPGVAIQGHLASGSETKDPGPYIDTELATPNVDRAGTDTSVTLDVASENLYLRTGFMTQAHSFTDLAMIKRNQNIYAGDGFMELGSVISFLKAGIKTSYSKHEISASYSEADTFFLFFKPVGREIPTNYLIGNVGAHGRLSISESLSMTYRLNYASHQIKKFPNTLDFDFDWDSRRLDVNLETAVAGAFYQSKVGIGFDRFHLNTSAPLASNFVDVAKIYGSFDYRLSDRIQQGVTAHIGLSGSGSAMKGAVASRWAIHSAHTLLTRVSLSQRLFEEDNSLWYWVDRGYNVLTNNGVDYTVIGDIDKRHQLTVDHIWTFMPHHSFTLELAGAYRFVDGLYLEQQNFDFHSDDCTFAAPVQIYADRTGQTLGGHISLNYRPVDVLNHRLFYSYRTPIAGDDIFNADWKSIPKHQASYRITYTPVPAFSIWAMLSHFSATEWTDYKQSDGSICELGRLHVEYLSAVKGATVLDLQLKKWFWRRKLQGSLFFHNVWDGNYRYHPIGASFDLSFYAQIQLFFDVPL